MINKEICIMCINRHTKDLWVNKDDRRWMFGRIICPGHFEYPTDDSTAPYLIKGKVPHGCIYRLEQLVNQDAE